jgi:cystathionine beta-lyase/cystathionine gamma-synthase
MIDAYNINNKAKLLQDYKNISENDLVCIESCNLPYCNDNKQVIKKLVQICHSINAYILVDNTYYTSYLFNPFLFNVDIVIESLSKYNNGYNSSLLGTMLIADSIKNKFSKIRKLSTILGFYPHPIDCYLTTIGLQTLPVRLNQIKKTTEIICAYLLEENININAIVETGIIMIKPKKIDYSLLKKIKIFQIADTFGVNFSVITVFNKEKLYRLSIGLEDSDDLILALSEIINELR